MTRHALLRLSTSLLALCVAACGAHKLERPATVTSVTATHDAGDGPRPLTLDLAAVLACLDTSRGIGIGEAQKCVFTDGDYELSLNDGETTLHLHTATQLTVNGQGFFSNDCLYPILAQAAHGKAPEPGGC